MFGSKIRFLNTSYTTKIIVRAEKASQKLRKVPGELMKKVFSKRFSSVSGTLNSTLSFTKSVRGSV